MSGTGGSSRDATTNDITAMMASAVPWMVEDTRIGMAGVLGTCCTFPVNRSNMTSDLRVAALQRNRRAVGRTACDPQNSECFAETAAVATARDRKNHAAVVENP